MLSDIHGKQAIVVGVSPDAAPEQQAFRGHYNLNFPLLCDTERKVGSLYGNWDGTKYWRSTFLIGADGIVKKTWPRVKVDGHAAEVLAAL